MRKVISSFGLIAYSAIAVSATPMPPLLEVGSGFQQTASAGFSDREYGATRILVDGVCPRIPSSFNNTYRVSTSAQFDAAYAALQPGDGIIVEDGNYSLSGITKTLGKTGGSSSNRYYIISETLHGVQDFATYNVRGSHHVVAGFRWNGSSIQLKVDGPDNRVACNYWAGSGYPDTDGRPVLATDSGGTADRLEADHNILNNLGRGFVFNRCDPQQTSCTDTSLGIHVHHNTFSNVSADPNPANDHEAIVVGLDYRWRDGIPNYNPNEEAMNMVIENNLFDGWNGEEELITIKSDRNIIRNNCVINSPNTYINLRSGDYNIITGNWQQGVRGGFRVSGGYNTIVFNYYSKAVAGNSISDSAWRIHPSSRVSSNPDGFNFPNPTRNILSYNVFSKFRWLIEERSVPRGDIFVAHSSDNLIEENVLYSDTVDSGSAYINVDATYPFSESQFIAANAWSSTRYELDGPLAETACGDETLFDGPGDETTRVVPVEGSLDMSEIRPPSWWN